VLAMRVCGSSLPVYRVRLVFRDGADTIRARIMMQQSIAVLGAGLMGAAIAAHFAVKGHDVRVYEVDQGRRQALAATVGAIYDELVEAQCLDEAGRSTALDRINATPDLAGLQSAMLVIEAVPERLELKHQLFRAVESVVATDAILASNTSGFTPDAIASGLASPERFLIAHFWNPPHLIPLVEIVPGSKTEPRVVTVLSSFLQETGAMPVVLEKPIPGFVGNRLQFALLREALHIVRTGAASAETVDTVMKASLGRRYALMGPLEGADLGGLDTFADIARHLVPNLSSSTDDIELLSTLVSQGHCGARTGQGFYTWTGVRREEMRRKRIASLKRSN
jgi:3-hydroxybutyryl-CoA dehydrogenase